MVEFAGLEFPGQAPASHPSSASVAPVITTNVTVSAPGHPSVQTGASAPGAPVFVPAPVDRQPSLGAPYTNQFPPRSTLSAVGEQRLFGVAAGAHVSPAVSAAHSIDPPAANSAPRLAVPAEPPGGGAVTTAASPPPEAARYQTRLEAAGWSAEMEVMFEACQRALRGHMTSADMVRPHAEARGLSVEEYAAAVMVHRARAHATVLEGSMHEA
ncbi:MAG: hypothetical protein ACRCU1_02435 [Alsobacter sp.]